MGGVAGIVGRVLSSIWRVKGGVSITDVKLNPGGGPNVTAEHFQPAGDDSPALPGDYGFAAPGPQAGRFAVVGYVDALNPPVAAPGEKRIYGRDLAGETVAAIWIKGDGTIRGENDLGWFELRTDGEFVANGARLTTTGDVVTSDGVSLRNHYHEQGTDTGGDSEADTEPPTATE